MQSEAVKILWNRAIFQRMHVETFAVGPLGCNCSIVADLEAKEAIVVDPGGDEPLIRAALLRLGVTPKAIVHTHTHIDHVGATAPLQRAYNVSAKIHELDRPLYDAAPIQAQFLRIPAPEVAQMDGDLVDAGSLHFGRYEMGVLHTPGHTPGSCCFQVKTEDQEHLFTGDTLFKRGIGRTDLWGGDFAQIMKSLREKVLTLPGDVLVVAGHGAGTTIGDEVRANPFLRR